MRSAAGLMPHILLAPGVNVKTWSVFPLDDGLEENHEAFSVALRNPQNAVMGQRNTAAVEIIDPRSGERDAVSVLFC